MKIVVDTLSGRGLTFAEKLDYDVQLITDPINEPCILITRNVGLGKIPPTTTDFLDKNASLVRGVVVNGMKRYGPFYCKAADKIAKIYNLPIVAKIELSGSDEDVVTVTNYIVAIEK